MPVKKTNKKTTKKSTSKKADNKIKKEIKQAVEEIPGLMFEHVNIEPTKKVEVPAKKPAEKINVTPPQTPRYLEPQGSRKLLWFSVILFTVVIFAMWIINSWVMFKDIKDNKIEGQIDLISDAKNNLDSALTKINPETGATTTPIEDLEKIKQQIKTNLESIIIYDHETSTTVTSTN